MKHDTHLVTVTITEGRNGMEIYCIWHHEITYKHKDATIQGPGILIINNTDKKMYTSSGGGMFKASVIPGGYLTCKELMYDYLKIGDIEVGDKIKDLVNNL